MEDEGNQVKDQERLLPFANISRIMKSTLPSNAKISKDAKEAMQEFVGEFISFLTSEAADRCLQEKKRTVGPEDIIFAMDVLGFENYASAMRLYLERYRDSIRIANKF